MKKIVVSLALIFCAFLVLLYILALDSEDTEINNANEIEHQRNENKLVIGPRMTDRELFQALNLENKKLSSVKSAFERGDFVVAKNAFVNHVKLRSKPKWFFSWLHKPLPGARPKNPNLTKVNRFARNELVSVGIWHDFGPDISWNANPTSNQYPEWTWQLNRHKFWNQLGSAYWNTGDEKYAKAFVQQMLDWVQDNPVPLAINNDVGSPWRTIDAGIRMSETWFDSFYYFLSSDTFHPEASITMIKSFVEHAHYLMEFNSKGNWLLHEMAGLYYIGAMFPEFKEAATWRETAIKRLYEEIEIQVYPDGVHFELTPSYHNISLHYFISALQMAQLNNYAVPDDYVNKLEGMYQYDLFASMPNGLLPAINDSDYSDAHGPLKTGSEFFPNRKDFTWVATDGKKGSRPTETSYAFPYAGQLIMRSGWGKDDRYLLFEVGPFGYSHQHEDKLNFVIHAYGTNLLIDPGAYAYDNSKWRSYTISSYAHNVIHVDGNDQHRRGLDRKDYIAKKPRRHVWKSNKDFDYASATFGEFPSEGFGDSREKIATHTRHILYVKGEARGKRKAAGDDYWLVVDVLKPNDEKEHTYEAMFHLPVESVAVDPNTKQILSLNHDAANLAIIPVADESLSVEVIKGQEEPHVQGWIPKINKGVYKVDPIPTVVFKRKAKGISYFVYLFYPLPKDGALPVKSVESVGLSPDSMHVKVLFKNKRVDDLQIGNKLSVRRKN